MGGCRYWLTPVSGPDDAPTLRSARYAMTAEEGEALRRWARDVHPFLVPGFKLASLLGGGGDGCGTGEGAALRLDEGGDVALTGAAAVSDCGRALLERLPAPSEALAATASLPPLPHLSALREWWSAGHRVVLLKEE